MRHMRSQDGIVMPVVIIILAISLLLAIVAGSQVLAAQETARRDINSTEALQAADAGLQTSVSRMNQLDLTGVNGITGLLTSLPCIINGTGVNITTVNLSLATAACPAVTETMANGASWSARVTYNITISGTRIQINPYVVSTGTAGKLTRRVKATLNLLNLSDPLSAVQGLNSVTLNGTLLAPALVPAGDVRSNGNITMSTGLLGAGTTSIVTQNATPGPGHGFTFTGGSSSQCLLWACVLGSHAAAANNFGLAPVSPPATNDDADFDTGAGALCPGGVCPGGGTWNASKRILTLTGADLTLKAGHSYWFCNVTMTNGSTLTSPIQLTTASVIYMEDPGDSFCNNGTGQNGSISLTGNSVFTNLNVALPQTLQIYAQGSSSTTTAVTITPAGGLLGTVGSALNPLGMLIYAPQSNVSLQNTFMTGMVAGKNVSLLSGTSVTNAAGLLTLPLDSLFPVFKIKQYTECSTVVPTAGQPIDTGC